MQTDRVEAATQRLIEMWESDQLPEAIKTVTLRRQRGDRPMDSWSLGNQLLSILNGTDDARGFRQWEQAGRKVTKGAKAFHILGPCVKKITDDKTGEEVSRLVGFKGIPVFAIEDTDGEPIEGADYSPPALPPLAEVAEAWGIKVTYGAGGGNSYGWFRPGQIHLVTHAEKVFFHELAHAAHNKVRALKGGQDPMQEIVAETTAAVLCLMYGIEGYGTDARAYVAHYAAMSPRAATVAVMKALGDIQKVLALILETAESLAEGREAA